MKIVIVSFIFLLLSTSAIAKVCKKGQPCGNSCISWNKTCRLNQSTLLNKQGKIINNSTIANVQSDSEAKSSTTIEAEFGCMVTWTALIDLHLFKKNEEEIINDVIYKIKTKAKFNKQLIDQSTEDEIRLAYKSTLNKAIIKNSELELLQTDVESFRNEFMESCIVQTKKIIAMRKAS
ncbi:hypothetical protein PSECIP111854_02152 [Pseudoalteromonas sp. CIP111854]|uniref:Uncharacterized protein n=1 Tax=Pseudoalteromonas holothuriae TaxID=2963714 RepID=A0A9W4QXW7_9GAMM|nr:hypothetical protein [Pseudoalteromonas sp. CIP111854]CAH9058199.1 hypothetical protein PSECIP111854_02152 [Pseudoalteromonas sp. CIP111854]